MNTKKMDKLSVIVLYSCFMLQIVSTVFGKNESKIENTQPEQEDTLTDATVSFGIRSFTVEVTTPTQKSKLATQNDSFSINNHTNEDETILSTTLISTQTVDSVEHFSPALMNMTTNNNVEITTIEPNLSIERVTHIKSSPQFDILLSTESENEQKVHEEETTDERPPSLPSSSILSTSTPSPTEKVSEYITSTQQVMINDIHVEEKLENGLYRIKLAEIITDEFHGGGSDEASSSINDNISSASMNVDKNDISNPEPYQQTQSIGGKINIIDLYPSKLEDFSPIIRESNEKIIKDKQIYLNEDHNMFPNSLNQIFDDVDNDNSQPPTSNIDIELIDEGRDVININEDLNPGKSINTNNNVENQTKTVNSSKRTSIRDDRVTDFTGKLQEQDGVITEIEKKFRLDDLKRSTAMPITVNHRLDFIDRRVKKNDPFMSKFKFYNSDGTLGRIDFANTKFNTDSSISNKNAEEKDKKLPSAIDKPEFSTTKFYNSKELYNEMIHKKYDTNALQSVNSKKIDLGTPTSLTTTRPEGGVLKSTPNSGQFEQRTDSKTKQKSKAGTNAQQEISETSTQTSKIETTAGVSATTFTDNEAEKNLDSARAKSLPSPTSILSARRKVKDKPLIAPTTAFTPGNKTDSIPTTTIAITAVPASTVKVSPRQKPVTKSKTETISTIKSSFQEQPKGGRARNYTKTTPSLALSTATQSTTTISNQPLFTGSESNIRGTSAKELKPTVTTPPPTHSKIIDDLSQHQSASTKASAATPTIRKPFSRPRVLTRLQEKINSLECEIQNMPPESHLWRGNETHELYLPITTPEDCSRSNEKCTPVIISWEGQVEIQSGDVLLVEINDALLLPVDYNQTNGNTSHKATTAVYQVTRPGHEHCDVTEGVLLDITPLVVDGRKLVTLYDKDLTEGVNLLIVVSELWRSQCVRLKVTVKSDNCGENADCSGKGVCFSNASMEGYECQCCSGFAGSHCEEIDACSPSPCTNNGICVDLSQGHEGNAYQCLCPYGFTGKNCQYESDPCNPTDCMNGGSCVGNATHFRCDCAPGYTGPLCQHNLNECESSPCVHGICVDEEDGFRCFCQPGFSGELCNFEYNECESNPCLNGGQCNDQIGGFECKCTRGYTGNRCHIKVEFCANGPCPEGHRCIDRGDDFTCECPGGRNGPDCNQVPRTQCTVNPCANGGTCWTSEESFYCACRPGYTGKMCEDEFVVETVVSSSEFMTDDTSARGSFNEKGFGATVAKAPIELHNAYIAAGTLAAAIFIVAIVVTICHCKVHQTYRRFSTRHHQLIPIFGFGRRNKSPKSHRHWLSGKGGVSGGNPVGSGNLMGIKSSKNHLPGSSGNGPCHNHHIAGQASSFHHHHQHQIHERPFQRHLAMNLENDMYYTVDFSDSQHSPLIQ